MLCSDSGTFKLRRFIVGFFCLVGLVVLPLSLFLVSGESFHMLSHAIFDGDVSSDLDSASLVSPSC